MKKYYRYATISPTKMMGRINWNEINEAGRQGWRVVKFWENWNGVVIEKEFDNYENYIASFGMDASKEMKEVDFKNEQDQKSSNVRPVVAVKIDQKDGEAKKDEEHGDEYW